MTILGIMIMSLTIIYGCSSVPNPPKLKVLNTTVKKQNYYYCESCLAPTELSDYKYQLLQLDEPLAEIKPDYTFKQLEPPKKNKINRSKTHKLWPKKTSNKLKRCI